MKMSALGARMLSLMAVGGGFASHPTLRTNQTRRNKPMRPAFLYILLPRTTDARWWHDLKDVNQIQAKADAAVRRLRRADKLNNWAESVTPNPFYNAQ